jgi:hypothetical protein
MTITISRPALFTPPTYDATQWPHYEGNAKESVGYAGTKFDFSLVTELIRPVSNATVEILGVDMHAMSIQLETSVLDPNYPIYEAFQMRSTMFRPPSRSCSARSRPSSTTATRAPSPTVPPEGWCAFYSAPPLFLFADTYPISASPPSYYNLT